MDCGLWLIRLFSGDRTKFFFKQVRYYGNDPSKFKNSLTIWWPCPTKCTTGNSPKSFLSIVQDKDQKCHFLTKTLGTFFTEQGIRKIHDSIKKLFIKASHMFVFCNQTSVIQQTFKSSIISNRELQKLSSIERIGLFIHSLS